MEAVEAGSALRSLRSHEIVVDDNAAEDVKMSPAILSESLRKACNLPQVDAQNTGVAAQFAGLMSEARSARQAADVEATKCKVLQGIIRNKDSEMERRQKKCEEAETVQVKNYELHNQSLDLTRQVEEGIAEIKSMQQVVRGRDKVIEELNLKVELGQAALNGALEDLSQADGKLKASLKEVSELEREMSVQHDELIRTASIASRVAASQVKSGIKDEGTVSITQHLAEIKYMHGENCRLKDKVALLEKQLQVADELKNHFKAIASSPSGVSDSPKRTAGLKTLRLSLVSQKMSNPLFASDISDMQMTDTDNGDQKRSVSASAGSMEGTLKRLNGALSLPAKKSNSRANGGRVLQPVGPQGQDSSQAFGPATKTTTPQSAVRPPSASKANASPTGPKGQDSTQAGGPATKTTPQPAVRPSSASRANASPTAKTPKPPASILVASPTTQTSPQPQHVAAVSARPHSLSTVSPRTLPGARPCWGSASPRTYVSSAAPPSASPAKRHSFVSSPDLHQPSARLLSAVSPGSINIPTGTAKPAAPARTSNGKRAVSSVTARAVGKSGIPSPGAPVHGPAGFASEPVSVSLDHLCHLIKAAPVEATAVTDGASAVIPSSETETAVIPSSETETAVIPSSETETATSLDSTSVADGVALH